MTITSPSKKQIKETAIRLWKNDFPNTPISIGSTEWELYMVKAEQIESQPTVIDRSSTDELYSALAKVLKNENTLQKAWEVILQHRAKFVEYAKGIKGVQSNLQYLPEAINDYYYDDPDEADLYQVWGEDGVITSDGEVMYQFIRDFLCIDDIGIGKDWDSYAGL